MIGSRHYQVHTKSKIRGVKDSQKTKVNKTNEAKICMLYMSVSLRKTFQDDRNKSVDFMKQPSNKLYAITCPNTLK